MTYPFTDDEIKAYHIKDGKLRAYLPFASCDWATAHKDGTLIAKEPNSLDLTMIAEIELEGIRTKTGNQIHADYVTIKRMLYYDAFTTPVMLGICEEPYEDNKHFCDIYSPNINAKHTFRLRSHTWFSDYEFRLSTRRMSDILPAREMPYIAPTHVLFSTLKQATDGIYLTKYFSEKPKLIVSSNDAPDTETLNINLFKKVYSHAWEDYKHHYAKDLRSKDECAYILFKPSKNAHIYIADGIVVADHVVPICMLYDPRIPKTLIQKPKLRWNYNTSDINSPTPKHAIPEYGKPITYPFGEQFMASLPHDVDYYATTKIRK